MDNTMDNTKYVLVIDNVPASMIEEMKCVAATHGLPVTLWLKLLIQSELRKEAERCQR